MATQIIKLCDIVVSFTGKTVPFYSKGNVPYLDIEALERGNIKRYVGVNANVDDNDIIIVKDGTRCGMVLRGKEGKLGSTLLALRIRNGVSVLSEYLYLYLLYLTKEKDYFRKGSTVPHIDREKLLDSEILVPDLATQQMKCSEITPYINMVDTINNTTFRIEDLLQYVTFKGKNVIRQGCRNIKSLVSSALQERLHNMFSKL